MQALGIVVDAHSTGLCGAVESEPSYVELLHVTGPWKFRGVRIHA